MSSFVLLTSLLVYCPKVSFFFHLTLYIKICGTVILFVGPGVA